MIDLSSFQLPVAEVLPELQKKLTSNPTVVLQAPPGAGKSTLVPLGLLDLPFLDGRKIIMLEPRRIAARSIAQRMSDMLGEKVGGTVGYRVRFDSCISDKTRIEVITEGILTRMLLADNSLENVGMVIFDEFHERSIHADLSLALAKESQDVLRDDLRILIMSATLDISGIASALDAPSVVSDGKLFPVEIRYTGDADKTSIAEQCALVIKKALKESDGDILAFLPGQGEIHQLSDRLKSNRQLNILPLYGALPFSRQWAAIQPSKDQKRRVVLATSIAETSLTIEGICIVVDCGFGRGMDYNPGSGLSRLHTYRISVDEADQRSGRAGRLGPGVCYRMWTPATHLKLKPHRIPEIESQDLTSFALNLTSWGCQQPEKLFWLSRPPKGTYLHSMVLLEELGAVSSNKITELGTKMNRLPCHPRIAHMLVEAHELGNLDLAADLAAILEERDPLTPDFGADINHRVDWLRRKRREKSTQPSFRRIDQIAQSYARLFEEETSDGEYDPYETGVLLSYSYPERIASAQASSTGRYQLSNGHVVKLPHKDDLSTESWLVIANMDARDQTGKVFLGAAINPQDLASQVIEKEVVKWDHLQGKIVAETQMRVGSLVISSTPLQNVDPTKITRLLIEAIRESDGTLLTWDDLLIQFQYRVHLYRQQYDVTAIPDLGREALLDSLEDWLAPYLMEIKSSSQLKKLNLYELISRSFTYKQGKLLDEKVPERITVPSGSSIKITYEEKQPPVLAVRIQELFGLTESPSICDGKIRLKLHLLSPGFKPVQITDDLNSFWLNTYSEVKKELKGRYPKHVWPNDPMTEPATNRAKTRK